MVSVVTTLKSAQNFNSKAQMSPLNSVTISRVTRATYFMQSPAQVVVITTLVRQKENCANVVESIEVPYKIRTLHMACMSIY